MPTPHLSRRDPRAVSLTSEPLMTTEPEDSATHSHSEEDDSDPWWKTLLTGIGLLIFSGFLWWYFTDFENSTETTRRMNAILAMLYNFGGKALAVGVVAAIGAGTTGLGVYQFFQRKS